MSDVLELTPRTRALIIQHEGLNQPWKVPPLESGITLGWGDDLGQRPKGDELLEWLAAGMKPDHVRRLRSVIGLKGDAARRAAPNFRDIQVTVKQADLVFDTYLWPKYARQAAAAFPGLEALGAEPAGALVSLVYNRGPDVPDYDETKPRSVRREEMDAIRDFVAARDHVMIAKLLCWMAHRWDPKKVPGLIKRRLDEAALVDPRIVNEVEYHNAKQLLRAA